MAENIIELLAEVQDLVAKLEVIGFGNGEESVTHNGVTRSTLAKAMNEEVASRWVAIASVAQSRNVVETFTELPASSDGSVMYDVWNDLVLSRNGLYGWDGSAWIKSPFDVNRSALDANRRIAKYWLAPATTHDFNDFNNGPEVVSAILSARGYGIDSQDEYFIAVFCNNHATYNDRIIVRSVDGTKSWTHADVIVPGKLDAPVWVSLLRSDGSRFELLVDYRLLIAHEGVLVSTTSPYFPLSKQILLEGEQLDKLGVQENKIENLSIDVKHNSVFKSLDSTVFDNASYVEVVKCFEKCDFSSDMLKDETYTLAIFKYLSPSEQSRVWIKDSAAVLYSFEGSLNSSGRQTVQAAGPLGFIEIMLNLDELSANKIYVNSDSSPFIVNFDNSDNSDLYDRVGSISTPFVDRGASNLGIGHHATVAAAIVGFRVLSGDVNKAYGIITFSKNDETYNNNIFISDGTETVASIVGPTFQPDMSGITRIVVPEAAGSGVEIELFIDYRKLSSVSGVLVSSGSGYPIWLNNAVTGMPSLVIDEIEKSNTKLRNEIVVATGSTAAVSRNLRVSFVGSSTTWGAGFLGEGSYAGAVENVLRNKYATTLVPSDFTTAGAWQVFNNESMCYESSVGKLTGVNSTIDFDLYGDELSIALCKEQGNSGAAIVELLVDGQVYDTFSTFNDLPSGSDVFSFVGDGTSKTFDLGRAFTFDHVVTLDSAAQAGQVNQGGYGGTFGASDVWMVVRKLFSLGGGEYEVRHFLTFKDAPAAGVNIQCNYNYGESLKPTKSTVANLSGAIGSGLESPYGSGSTSYDPANPVGLSSGLDFRQNDPRAIKTWRFTESSLRNYQLRIKSLDARATGAEPDLFVSFVTNRMHYLQNAGIGGYRADVFLQDTHLTTLRQIAAFRPDMAITKLAGNDDWVVHEFKAWNPRTGVTDAELRNDDSAHYFKTIAGSGDNYSVDDSRCPVIAVTPFSVTFDSGVVLGSVAAGDQLIFGDYKGDSRRLVIRIVDSWAGHTANFTQELLPDDFVQLSDIAELVGSTAQVKSVAAWEQNIRSMITGLRESLPSLKVGISTAGVTNYYMRRLEGYIDTARLMASTLEGVEAVDAYSFSKRWQYSLPQSSPVYLTDSQGNTSTGASDYSLYLSNGSVWQDRLPRNVSVKVDGIERANDACFISGGETKGWPVGTVTMTLENDESIIVPQKLIFTDRVPAVGAVIEISYTPQKWSSDDTHPNAAGDLLFGAAAMDVLRKWI